MYLRESKQRQADGGNLYLINVKEGLWDALEACDCFDKEGSRNVFQSKSAAIHAIYQKLDKSLCEGCTARLFKECKV